MVSPGKKGDVLMSCLRPGENHPFVLQGTIAAASTRNHARVCGIEGAATPKVEEMISNQQSKERELRAASRWTTGSLHRLSRLRVQLSLLFRYAEGRRARHRKWEIIWLQSSRGMDLFEEFSQISQAQERSVEPIFNRVNGRAFLPVRFTQEVDT